MPLPWIPRIYLSPQFFKKLELCVLANDLGIDRADAAIAIVRFWWLAHIRNNDITPADEQYIDATFGAGFSAAMLKAGWICLVPPGHVSVPKFDKYLSKRATRRIERAIRLGSKEGFKKVDNEEDIADIVRSVIAGNDVETNLQVLKLKLNDGKVEKPKKGKGPKVLNLTLFEQFYKAYPKKRSRGDAEKAFKAIGVTEELLQQMLAAIAKQSETWEWRKQNGQFIPYPATWLRAKGWLDEGSAEGDGSGSGGRIRAEKGKYDSPGEGSEPIDPPHTPARTERTLFDDVAEGEGGDRSIPY